MQLSSSSRALTTLPPCLVHTNYHHTALISCAHLTTPPPHSPDHDIADIRQCTHCVEAYYTHRYVQEHTGTLLKSADRVLLRRRRRRRRGVAHRGQPARAAQDHSVSISHRACWPMADHTSSDKYNRRPAEPSSTAVCGPVSSVCGRRRGSGGSCGEMVSTVCV